MVSEAVSSPEIPQARSTRSMTTETRRVTRRSVKSELDLKAEAPKEVEVKSEKVVAKTKKSEKSQTSAKTAATTATSAKKKITATKKKIKDEVVNTDDLADADAAKITRKRTKSEAGTTTTKSTKRKAAKTEPKVFVPPASWRSDWRLIEEIRSKKTAPVDFMGAEALGASDEDMPFHTLMALMLSSQTKDQVVAEAMSNLKKHGLSVENIASTDADTLNKMIQKVGFHNNKTKHIKAAVEIIQREHGGKVPDTIEGLMALPGVGPKMGFLVLHIAFGKYDAGIGVDTHMHRMLNVLQWVESKNPEQTRIQLQSWLPVDLWKDVNLLFVGIGQMIQQPAERAKLLEHLDSMPEKRRKEALQLLQKLGLKSSTAVKISGK